VVAPDGQRTEIVQRGDLDHAGLERLKNTGHETQANPVAEFCVLEAEVTDFLEHGTAIGMAVRVPTSGEGIHRAAKK